MSTHKNSYLYVYSVIDTISSFSHTTRFWMIDTETLIKVCKLFSNFKHYKCSFIMEKKKNEKFSCYIEWPIPVSTFLVSWT